MNRMKRNNKIIVNGPSLAQMLSMSLANSVVRDQISQLRSLIMSFIARQRVNARLGHLEKSGSLDSHHVG